MKLNLQRRVLSERYPRFLLIHGIIQIFYFRQVLEETGYNLASQLVPEDVIEITIRGQKVSLFIVPGVPEGFNFQTKTRKEISVR